MTSFVLQGLDDKVQDEVLNVEYQQFDIPAESPSHPTQNDESCGGPVTDVSTDLSYNIGQHNDDEDYDKPLGIKLIFLDDYNELRIYGDIGVNNSY